MQMREAAERVLFSTTLEEKLMLVPRDVIDDCPGPALRSLSEGPGRPHELRISEGGIKMPFPGTGKIGDEKERGRLLHFLANHELLAAELMALVLLRFPDAPKEYRAGVYEALREEQMHTRLYLRRMRECGVEFGELPVNDYFWKLVSPVESPLEFVTRLNLTFEQANLDFSKHYAQLFREAGDNSTAAVLEKIYQDEIGHVGHGVKWFRHWKKHGTTDWEAFSQAQKFPLSAARAKGTAPFNVEGRRLAGLDEDFIRHLQVYEQSRGRTPVLNWFNPNAEARVMEVVSGERQDLNKHAVALEEDLELLTLAWCRRDDIAVLRRRPSPEHLSYLKEVGLELPEIVMESDLPSLKGRKLGGVKPWAWSPDASDRFRPLAEEVSPTVPMQWREALPREWFSKEIGIRMEENLDWLDERGAVCRSVDEAHEAVRKGLHRGAVLVKAAYSCAGRGHYRIESDTPEATVDAWLRQAIAKHRCVIVERWLERLLDFSALYEIDMEGAHLAGMTIVENDAAGRYLGTRVSHKWGSMLDPGMAAFLFKECRVMDWYERAIPEALTRLLPGYTGPVGVDAMVHRRGDGSYALKPVVEMNVRMSMGRVAIELHKRKAFRGDGRLRILRKKELPEPDQKGLIFLTDPLTAREFVAAWEKL
jgi:uncharacterized ferritin-like protein (DUF455 family)